jgi:WD40 repeat protein
LATTATRWTRWAFAPDGRTLASSASDGTVTLWEVSDPARPRRLGRPLTGDDRVVNAVAFAPDGRTLASGSGDGTVTLWDLTELNALPNPRGSARLLAYRTRL